MIFYDGLNQDLQDERIFKIFYHQGNLFIL